MGGGGEEPKTSTALFEIEDEMLWLGCIKQRQRYQARVSRNGRIMLKMARWTLFKQEGPSTHAFPLAFCD